MNPTPLRLRLIARSLATATALAVSLSLRAQSAPTTKPPESGKPADDAVVLNPFEVSAGSDNGYAARDTLAGTRFKTELKDVPSQVSVMTKEFLEDIASVSMEDAYRYSINVENTAEFMSATNASGDFNNGVINTRTSNRIRGLSSPGVTHDFFRTTLQQDAYNTDRLSYSSGPNAILFGNGNPAGIVDTSFIRANLRQPKYTLSLRTDNYQSLRTSLDLNQPVVKDRVALRLAAVKLHDNAWREPGSNDTERFFGTITLKPFAKTTVRAYYEKSTIDQIIPRNTRIGDQVSPWIAAGRPVFDNGLTTPTASPAATDLVFTRNTATKNVFVFGAAAANPYLVWGSGGTSTAATVTRYSATTKGPGDAPYQSGTDSYLYSLAVGDSISPVDVSVNGNGTRNLMHGSVQGLSVEQQVGPVFLQLDYNWEKTRNPVSDFLRGIDSAIRVDANKFLPDRVTPNPNLGRYYVEGSGRVTAFRNDREEVRFMASYELDLTQRSQWLGRHRFAGLVQISDSIDNQQDYAARAVPAGTPESTIIDNYAGAQFNTTNWRAYLSNPKDASTGSLYYLSLPLDPFKPFKLPDGSTVYTYENPYGATTQSNFNHSRLEGRVVAMQNYFLGGRLVTSVGWRADNSRSAVLVMPRKTSAPNAAVTKFSEIAVPDNWSVYTSGHTQTAGAVAHVFPWLSFFYNHSSTWNPPRAALNPDGSPIPGSIGDGRDYGVMLRALGDRVSLRVNRYRNTSGPDISSFRTQIIPVIQNIEETLQDAADARTIPQPPKTGYNPNLGTFVYDLVSDQVAEGYEFELVANPTRNWRLAFSGAKAASEQSNIGGAWIDFIKQRLPLWTQYANLAGPGTSGTTIGSRFTGVVQTLDLVRQSDGQKSEQGRDWRINLVSRYSFSEGALKGAFVGGGYRWRSKSVTGYLATTVPNEFVYPGAPAQITVPSIKAPLFGRDISEAEAFVGYSHRLGRRVDWRVQLNVRNLFDDGRLIGQRANTAGALTVFALPEPRSFILTNTFTF